MDATNIRFTIEVDGRGEVISVKINNNEPVTRGTHTLYEEQRLPLGVLKGSIPIGGINYYEGSFRICYDRGNGDLY